MSIEALTPAEQHLDALVAVLVDCAMRGKQLADDLAKTQAQHNKVIAEQIGVSQEIDNFLEAHCEDSGRRWYIKGLIAETLRAAVYPEQLPAGAEHFDERPDLRLVQGEG